MPLFEADGFDWAGLTAKLPIGRDAETKRVRKELFHRWDVNGNGVLSLMEVDTALKAVMGLDELFAAKPVVMRAFQAARDMNK